MLQHKFSWYDLLNEKTVFVMSQKVSAEPLSSVNFECERGGYDPQIGFWLAETDLEGVEPSIFYETDFKNLEKKIPHIVVNCIEKTENKMVLDFTTDSFAHAVQLNLSGKAVPDDNYFDLIPGRNKKVIVDGSIGSLEKLIARVL